jgi:hypothetical protein
MITMITIVPVPINMGCSSRICGALRRGCLIRLSRAGWRGPGGRVADAARGSAVSATW